VILAAALLRINNMTLDKKKTQILKIAFLGFLILSCFLISFLFKEIKKSSKSLSLTKRELAVIAEKTKQTSVLKEKMSIISPDLEKIKKVFINTETPIDFFQFLEKTAKDQQISIKTSISAKIEKENALAFNLSLAGPFPNCLQFLGKLETAPYLIEIENFTARQLPQEVILQGYKEIPYADTDLNVIIKVFSQ